MIQLRRSLMVVALALVAVRVVYWLMNAELVRRRTLLPPTGTFPTVVSA
jgi:hypothetical protein